MSEDCEKKCEDCDCEPTEETSKADSKPKEESQEAHVENNAEEECNEECNPQECGEDCCCNAPLEEVDLPALGAEAEELGAMFEELNTHLIDAIKVRQKILETAQKHASESQEMKEKMDKVLRSRHPVLLQFVFGQ
ncbi:MAG: hypothetical protein ABH983_01475 [Candidatus Micrarchaeota archaeon]|nr:hypothetical protein [Candidatus Micrarchaeota archaeon]MBU1681576.1 hypothetical protein [Candidatus Micrarchaeota archaeon]